MEKHTTKQNSYSDKQRKALHKWCELSADVLNKNKLFRHGVLDYRKVYRWDKDSFKHYIYKPALMAYTGKKSTEDQTSVDPSDIYLIISSHILQEHGIQLPDWPSYR